MRKHALIPVIMMLFSCAGNPSGQSLSSSVVSSVSSSGSERSATAISSSDPTPSESSSPTGESSSEESLSAEPSSEPSSSAHSHTYEEGYEFDEEHHWREATCGHEGRGDYGPHEFSISYDVEDSAIVVVHTCVVCGYGYKESTYDEHQFDTATFKSASSGGVYLSSLGEHTYDSIINYPREVDGEPLVMIDLREGADDSPYLDHAVAFVPNTVRNIFMLLAYAKNMDIFFEMTVEEYLSLKLYSFNLCRGEFNLHLLDGEGHYYLVRDLVLPDGLERFKGAIYFADSTIETITCNSDLQYFDAMECYRLREIRFNEGLETIGSLSSLNVLHHMSFPSTLKTVYSLSLKHLYTVTIAEGTSKDFVLSRFESSPRLVGVFDHRTKQGRAAADYPKTVFFNEDNEDEFRLVKNGDYIYAGDGNFYCLIDYVGTEFEVTLPTSIEDDGRTISSYAMMDILLHVVNPVRDDMDEEALREMAEALHDRFFAIVHIPASVTSVIKTLIGPAYCPIRAVYCEMGQDSAMALFGGDPASYFQIMQPYFKMYCLNGGAYVQFYPKAE